jgi:hypothetical protein
MPVGIRITLDAHSKAALDKLNPEMADKGIMDGFRDWQPMFLRTVKEVSADKAKKTGTFMRSWAPGDITPQSVSIINTAGYAGVVEFGSVPHDIYPRNKKALAWRSSGAGPVSAFNAKVTLKSGKPGALHPSNFAFAKHVHHPGTKGKFIFREAFDKSVEALFNCLKNSINNVFTGS